ncbi:MAG: HAD family hydrolase [Oscillospiraceae bacterium]|nr:HAD family hydrolase [Oscillospiraceae bacterium]
MIEAVFLDVDNTLTSSATRTIPASALEALRRARAKGVRVFAATGRNTRTAEEGAILRGVPLDGFVACNGQVCYLADGVFIRRRPLDPRDVAAVLDFCRQRDCALLVGELECNYISRVDDVVRAFQKNIKIPLYEVRDVSRLPEREVYGLAPFLGPEGDEALRAALRSSTTVRYNPITCDVIPLLGGKDVGMRSVLEYFGIPAESSMAFGDGGNDIAMLRAAGVGVAMGGSEPDVLAAADVVAPGVDEDGIYKVFEMYNLL